SGVGDLRPVQPCDDLFDGELTEDGIDPRVQLLAVGYTPGVAVEAGVGRHLGQFEHKSAEACPLALILEAQVDLLAIAGAERTIGRDGGVTSAGAGRWSAAIGREVRRIAHPLPESLEERDFEDCPFPRSFTLVERREYPRKGIHASGDIRNRDADLRWGFGHSGHGDESRFTLYKQVISLLVTIGTRRTVAGDATHNQARVALGQLLRAQPQPLSSPWSKILD